MHMYMQPFATPRPPPPPPLVPPGGSIGRWATSACICMCTCRGVDWSLGDLRMHMHVHMQGGRLGAGRPLDVCGWVSQRLWPQHACGCEGARCEGVGCEGVGCEGSGLSTCVWRRGGGGLVLALSLCHVHQPAYTSQWACGRVGKLVSGESVCSLVALTWPREGLETQTPDGDSQQVLLV